MNNSETPKLDELYLQLTKFIDNELKIHPELDRFLRASYPRKQPSQIIIIGFSIIVVLLTTGILGYNTVVLVGSAYPLYRTIKATTDNDPDDRKRWLTFWLIFGITTYSDGIIRFVLGFIPFYNLLKLALYIALAHPRTDLAMRVYVKFIKPYITKVQLVKAA